MFPLFIAFIAFADFGAAQPQVFVSCNITQLETCHGMFMSQLGYTNSKWYDYKTVRKNVEQKYAAGKLYGLQLVCKYFGDFKQCFSSMGSAQDFAAYQACTEQPLGLLLDADTHQRTYTKEQARGYVKFIAQFDFACGAGLGVFAEFDDCMGDMFKNYTENLELCQDAYDWFVQRPDADTNICSYQMDVANCYRNIFKKCGVQSGWFGCEYERTGIAAVFSQCTQNFCSADTGDE